MECNQSITLDTVPSSLASYLLEPHQEFIDLTWIADEVPKRVSSIRSLVGEHDKEHQTLQSLEYLHM